MIDYNQTGLNLKIIKNFFYCNKTSQAHKQEISHEQYLRHKKQKKLYWCVDAGRSGTRWLSEIFSAHQGVVGSCERRPFAEAFYRYCKWNALPIDMAGIVELIKNDVCQDFNNATSVFVSNFLYSNIKQLCDEFAINKVIFSVNDPKFTITSFYNKGWYANQHKKKNPKFIGGPQVEFGEKNINRNFTRLVPKDNFYEEWLKLTRVGKIAWFWETINEDIYNNINRLPADMVWIFKLEEADQNYEYYMRMAEYFNLNPLLSKKKFLALKRQSVKKSDNIRRQWSTKEKAEYERFTAKFYSTYCSINNSFP